MRGAVFLRRIATATAVALVASLLAPNVAEAQRRRRPQRHRPAPPARPERPAPPPEEPAAAEPPPPVSEAPPSEAPPPEAPPPAEEPGPERPDAAAGEAAEELPVSFDLSGGVRLFRRDFFYSDDLFGELRPYALEAAPAVALAAEWYPGAYFTTGPLAHVGLLGAFDHAFALDSRDERGTRYATTARSYDVGLRVRAPFGRSEAGAVLAYGGQLFAIRADDPATDPGVPDVSYQYVRAGLNGRLALSERVALSAAAAYLFVLSTGEISSAAYFPRSRAGGVEASLGLALGIAAGFEVRTSLELRRYFYAMNPEPGDPRVAGGAVDQYAALNVGVAFRR